MEIKYYSNERSIQIVVSLLKAHGIRKVVASPGTTNLTLVGSLQCDPYFEIYSSVDERSAAYLACGLAAESGEGVVLSCTGATASRNYLSGLTEAYYRKLPVIAITSNQGEERIGHLIAQNIDRRSIPNDIANISVSIPTIKDKNDEWNAEILINKALLETTRNGGGPAHINLSTSYSRDFTIKEIPQVRVIRRFTAFDNLPTLPEGKIGIFIGSHKKFTEEETKALDAFCGANNAVAFCDSTSGYYGKYRMKYALVLSLSHYQSATQDLDLLIHIGEVSGDYSNGSLKSKEVWRISEDGEIKDTFRKLTNVFQMPESFFFTYYSKQGGTHTSYLESCKEEYNKIYAKIPDLPFGNIWIAKEISCNLPKNCELHLGILNTLRSWNFFETPNGVETYSNVGGFGIDGDISTLIGSSLVNSNKLYFGIFGDLAFFYDMNVMGNHHVGNNVRIMLINNGRGTEFRNFNHPAARFGEDADKYMAAAGHFGNMSQELVKHFAQDLGYEYLSADNKTDFENKISRFLTEKITDRPMIFEVFTESSDESNALETMYNLEKNNEDIIVEKVASAIRNTVGEKGIKIAKKILGKQ